MKPKARYRIHVWDKMGGRIDTDYADTEEDARKQAAGWTGQRGQMTWRAVIVAPDYAEVAVYKRGVEVPK